MKVSIPRKAKSNRLHGLVLVLAAAAAVGIPEADATSPLNTAHVRVEAGPHGSVMVEATARVTVTVGASDEVLFGSSGSHQRPRVSLEHVPPAAARAGVSFGEESISVQTDEEAGALVIEFGVERELEPWEVFTAFIGMPGRSIINARWSALNLPDDGGATASLTLLPGAASVPVAGRAGSTGVIAGGAAAGWGSWRVSVSTPIVGMADWTDCIGWCWFQRREPNGSVVDTWAGGDPITGYDAVSRNGWPRFLGPAGEWSFEWDGTFLRNSVVSDVTWAGELGTSEPVAFVYLPAPGVVAPADW